jgi:F0F1-type ATP synthase assembly protein I
MKNYDVYKINRRFNIEKFKNDNYNNKGNNKKIFKSLLNLNVGVYIIAPIFLFLIIGFYLDNYFNTKPFFLVLCIIIGTISSFYNLYKLTAIENDSYKS